MRLSTLVTAASNMMLCVTCCYCESISSDGTSTFQFEIAWLMSAFVLLFTIAFNLMNVYSECTYNRQHSSLSTDYRELRQRLNLGNLKKLVIVFFLLALISGILLCRYTDPKLVIAMMLLYVLVGCVLKNSHKTPVMERVRDGILSLLYSVFAMLFIFLFEDVLPTRNNWSIVVVICMTMVAALLSANQFLFHSIRVSIDKPTKSHNHRLGRVKFIRVFDLYAIHGLIATLCMLCLSLQYSSMFIPSVIYIIIHFTIYKYSSTNPYRIKQLARLTAVSSLFFAMLFCSLYVINVSGDVHKNIPMDEVEVPMGF